MRGKAENHDFTLTAEDLRRLRESVVIWRAEGGVVNPWRQLPWSPGGASYESL
jgi:hypothetical protein